MDMYPKYISPFGYQTNDGKIDSYGVDHSGFITRDEIEYQFARNKREQDLMKQYNAQGITKNYPQYGTNFWGNSANNYGFGNSNISANIENMQNTTPQYRKQQPRRNNKHQIIQIVMLNLMATMLICINTDSTMAINCRMGNYKAI